MFLRLVLTLLTVVSAKELVSGGTIHYQTERLNRGNYQASFGHLCNDSLCLQNGKDSENHVPILPLHELERRQRVASLQRLYIASQHYQPHIEHRSTINGSRKTSNNITRSRITYDFGVDSLKAELAFRISPTSPPVSQRIFPDVKACRHYPCNRSPAKDTFRVIYNDTCIRCPSRQLARISRNQRLAKVPLPKLKFCSRPDDFVTNFPLMVLRGPLMGSYVGEGEHTITFKTLYPLPAKTCRYTLKVFALRCSQLPVSRHGSFFCTNENFWGSRCLLKCDDNYTLKSNHSVPYKCVKRKREAIWKAPAVVPQCIGKVVTTTTTPPSTALYSPPVKRRLACRWPRTPKNGWTTCGLRGRWKKRLFVKENVPCSRGCPEGYIPSVPLDSSGKNRISCIGGSWFNFKEFECLSQTDVDNLAANKCRKKAEETNNVHCRESDKNFICTLECPEGFTVPKKFKSEAEFRCDAKIEIDHKWPTCEEKSPPMLVEGCENLFIKNVTFPVVLSTPKFRSKSPLSEIEVSCNSTSIESFGKFDVSCVAKDNQLDVNETCVYTVFSQATYCKPFKPGKQVIPKCMFPFGKTVEFEEVDLFPVNSLCEFICDYGYVITSSRIYESFTECGEDGAWSIDDFDFCRRNYS